MDESLAKVGADLLKTCMGLKDGESLLVVTDLPTREIGEALFQGGTDAGADAMLMVILPTGRNGAEPPAAVAAAMKQADVVVCPTKFSVTHTQARLEAAKAGARIATMPGITEEMFFKGAVSADYAAVADLSRRVTDLLSKARDARIVKDGKELTMSLEGRDAVASTGLYTEKGQSGNLPTGEAYIAPIEGTAYGETVFDGSIAGIGPLKMPVTVKLEKGLLVDADGPDGKRLLEMLGDAEEARNLGELGVGTNDRARITGVILEDEKVYGTVHLAFGDNSTFGGNTRAGVHIDGIIMKPDLYLDGRLVVSGGKLLI
ncbi:MAG: aminopeptidase [Actinobacteria bacterium]|nr:aminopeptidase [Actinomycetota bacterium]